MNNKNPCRKCEKAFVWNNRHTPSLNNECKACEKQKKYKEYLLSKRKFVAGDIITSLEELLQQEWVMFYNCARHIEVIKHNQLSTVLKWLGNGALRKAIRR